MFTDLCTCISILLKRKKKICFSNAYQGSDTTQPLKMRIPPSNFSGPPHLQALMGRCFEKVINEWVHMFILNIFSLWNYWWTKLCLINIPWLDNVNCMIGSNFWIQRSGSKLHYCYYGEICSNLLKMTNILAS